MRNLVAELTDGDFGLVSEAVAPGWEMQNKIEISQKELLTQFTQHKGIIERLAKNK